MNPSSLFGLTEHLAQLSKHGDPLEVLDATVDFEYFRGWLVEGLGYGDGAKGGRPPFDPVSMFNRDIPCRSLPAGKKWFGSALSASGLLLTATEGPIRSAEDRLAAVLG